MTEIRTIMLAEQRLLEKLKLAIADATLSQELVPAYAGLISESMDRRRKGFELLAIVREAMEKPTVDAGTSLLHWARGAYGGD